MPEFDPKLIIQEFRNIQKAFDENDISHNVNFDLLEEQINAMATEINYASEIVDSNRGRIKDLEVRGG